MTIEQRRDVDIIALRSTADVRQEATTIKKQYTDSQNQRTIDAAVGKVRDAIKAMEARIDAIETRQEKARWGQYIEGLQAQLSKLRAGDFDARPPRSTRARFFRTEAR